MPGHKEKTLRHWNAKDASKSKNASGKKQEQTYQARHYSHTHIKKQQIGIRALHQTKHWQIDKHVTEENWQPQITKNDPPK